MTTMRDFIEILQNNELDEGGAGVGRLVTHIREGMPFFMISAMRGDLPHSENLRRTLMLKNKLRKLPLTFISTEGEYHEKGRAEPSPELSFFVMAGHKEGVTDTDKMIYLATRLMHIFQQDSVLIGNGERIYLLENDGNEFQIGNAASFSMDAVKKSVAHSKIRGRKFTFTNTDDTPGSTRYAQDKLVANSKK